MSGFSVSGRRRRAYPRKFDWNEARERYAAGETMKAIAASYGVDQSAVQRVIRLPAEKVVAHADVPPDYSPRCPRCGGFKTRKAILCETCRREGRYGKGLEPEWDIFEPTTLEDLVPPSDYLAYFPPTGRYCLSTLWGYSMESRGEDRLRCDFMIFDCELGEAVQVLGFLTRDEAEAAAPTWHRKVRRLNARDARQKAA